MFSIAVWAYCKPAQLASYYQYPMHIREELAASFGEVREDHYHMGLDLRTMGRENIPVYAVADGYVSRIQVSEDGYGNVIFINHPNGTTSLYAHLSRLNDELKQYLHAEQYSSENWQQDIEVPAHRFNVKKNDFIAYSGNTGNTEGPHLHFEIRDTKTGNSLNPLIKRLNISDVIPPVIKTIYWYNRKYSIYKSEGRELLSLVSGPSDDAIYRVASPLISLGVEASDKIGDTRFTLGIYKARLYMDNVLKHSFSLNELGQQDTRYVNACIDYEKMLLSGKRIQYLFTLPGNRLLAYHTVPEPGILDISDGKPHRILIIVNDAAGNRTSVRFTLQLALGPVARPRFTSPVDVLYNTSTTLHSEHATVHFSRSAFYDTVPFILKEKSAVSALAASPLILLHNGTVPVQDNYKVSIQTTLPPNDILRGQTVMLWNTLTGTHAIHGSWKGNIMSGCFNELGTVQLVTDVVAPVIMLQSAGNLDLSAKPDLRISCRDNLGTIASFRGELDGQWIVFEKKGNNFTYHPDAYCKAGKHHLTITARDVAGNTTTKTFLLNVW